MSLNISESSDSYSFSPRSGYPLRNKSRLATLRHLETSSLSRQKSDELRCVTPGLAAELGEWIADEYMLFCDDDFRILGCSESLLRNLGYMDLSVRGLEMINLVPKLCEYAFYKQQKELASQTLKREAVVACGKIINLKAASSLRPFSVWIKYRVGPSGKGSYVWVLQPIDDNQLYCSLDSFGFLTDFDPTSGSLSQSLALCLASKRDKHFSTMFAECEAITATMGVKDLAVYLERKRYHCVKCDDGSVIPVRVKHQGEKRFSVSCLSFLSGLLVVDKSTLTIASFNYSFIKQLTGYSHHNMANALKGKSSTILVPDFQLLLQLCGFSVPTLVTESSLDSKRSAGAADITESAVVSPFNAAPFMEQFFPKLSTSSIPMSPFRSLSRKRTPSDISKWPQRSMTGIQLDLQDCSTEQQGQVYSISNAKLRHVDGSLIDVQIQILEQLDTRADANGGSGQYLLWITYKPSVSPLASDQGISPEQSTLSPGSPCSVIPSPELKNRRIHDFEIIKELGNGSYGYVRLARLVDESKRKNKLVVIKSIIKSRILVNSWTRDPNLGVMPVEVHVLNRIRRLRKSQKNSPPPGCAFISSLVDFFEDEVSYYVITEHRRGLDLFEFLRQPENSDGVSAELQKALTRQLCLALETLHSLDIVHRDIKTENVLVVESSKYSLGHYAVLIDFGSAAYVKDRAGFSMFCGTADYAAPEILSGERYEGKPQDMWSLGILFYNLLFLQPPFSSVDQVLTGELYPPFALEPKTSSLLFGLLQRVVERRLTVGQALEHQYFKG